MTPMSNGFIREKRMTLATRRLALALFLIARLGDVAAQGQPTPLRGALREKGKPIVDAAVFLQSFEDEHCAKIFASQKPSRKSQEKLDRCMHDVTTAVPDSWRYYEFTGLKPGWYAVHYLWNISEKPSPAQSLFKEGHWGVMYAGKKDWTGKYDTMAQDFPFYYSGKEDAARDFETQH
jgi:hypothetical protein